MVYTFESSNSKSIADKVEDFVNGIFSFGDKLKNLNTYIESNSWQKVGQKFQNIILQE